MRVFVAGSTGVVGQPLVRQLLAANHEVTTITRSEPGAELLRRQGVAATVCDVFDRDKLSALVASARPDAVIHQLTALPRRIDPRKINTVLAATNRLRSEGTQLLHEAAVAAGARRFIAQSVAFAHDPAQPGPMTEESALYQAPPPAFSAVIEAVRTLEEVSLGSKKLEGVVLRYGFFYGPGTVYAADGSFAEDAQRRQVPVIGGGSGVFSFIHVEDAAAAAVAALDRGPGGVYNITDDAPVPVAEWLPAYAALLGAKKPYSVPRWLAGWLAGPYAVYLMCELKAVSNSKAREHLGWTPRFPNWRSGFEEMLGASQQQRD